MRKSIYYCAASLDGYIAESDDMIDWLMDYAGTFEGEGLEPGPMAGSYDRFYAEVGALISGSATYEFLLDHMKSGGSWPYSGKPYWVLSSRELPLPDGHDGDVHVVNATVGELMDELSDAAGDQDLWIVGGGNVASQFADEGLLDELRLTLVPVVLGTGKRLFESRLVAPPLQLLGTTTYANGMVELRYAINSRATS